MRIRPPHRRGDGDGTDERDGKGKTESTQKEELHLNHIGEYLPPSMEAGPPTPEDGEGLRKVLDRREEFRKNHLKRRVSGKQKEYERYYNPKRQARLAANKTALFEEGAVLGANALSPAAAG